MLASITTRGMQARFTSVSARKAQSTTTRCLSTPLKSFSIGSFLS